MVVPPHCENNAQEYFLNIGGKNYEEIIADSSYKEKYKELQPEKYGDTIEKVIQKVFVN